VKSYTSRPVLVSPSSAVDSHSSGHALQFRKRTTGVSHPVNERLIWTARRNGDYIWTSAHVGDGGNHRRRRQNGILFNGTVLKTTAPIVATSAVRNQYIARLNADGGLSVRPIDVPTQTDRLPVCPVCVCVCVCVCVLAARSAVQIVFVLQLRIYGTFAHAVSSSHWLFSSTAAAAAARLHKRQRPFVCLSSAFRPPHGARIVPPAVVR
jgi:hypothetical protein